MTKNVSSSETRVIKTPPLLLGAVLLFWGWQSGLLLVGVVMGIILESARFVKNRWDLSDDDFRRISTFCTLLAFVMVIYAFTTREEGGSFEGLFQGPAAAHNASITSIRTSNAFFRWLPMILFFFVAAQMFSTREKIPWTAISIISRRRSQQEHKRSNAATTGGVNVSYPYFIICLFSASVHTNEGRFSFFWGQCVLIAWALWRFRSRRSGINAWVLALVTVICVGFFSQRSVSMLEQFVEGYNAQWLTRFLRQKTDPMQSMTAIGRIGELKLSGRIAIRLKTENGGSPPSYLREASYRAYHSQKQSWYVGSPRSDFENISPETNQTTWVLLPKTNTASVNIACYLDGGKALLPLPTGSGRLDNLNAYILQQNSEGAVLAEGPGLVIFDAHYGPGATLDSVPDIIPAGTNLDLFVPTNETPALDHVISEMKISTTNENQILQSIYGFFQNNFTYSIWQGKDKLATTNETPLARFLLSSRSGHCEYFATATVLLLRELKIPARYAVGYAVHEKSGHGYVVRERDAHAWCLVWNKQAKTWEDFDTTPASWVAEEGKRASVMQWLSDFSSWIGFQISKLRWGQTNLRQYIFWGLVPVLVILLYQIIFRRGRRRQQPMQSKKSVMPVFWPGFDSEFYQLEQKLLERGLTRQSGEPLSVWLQRVTDDPDLTSLKQSFQGLLLLHYRHRFDPQGLNQTEREALRQEVKICLSEKLVKMAPSGERPED
jgi:hypothetical protein